MTSILDGAFDRGPFSGERGQAGAAFERAVLSDGTPVIIKHPSTEGLFARLGAPTDLLYRLWSEGIFSRVPAQIEHAMLAVESDGDGWIIVMRDVSETILAADRVLSRAENERVLLAVDAMHREFAGETIDGLMPPRVVYGWSSPSRAASLTAEFEIAALVIRGWEMFAQVASLDVAEAMTTMHDDIEPFIDALDRRPSTLIHGDLHLRNVGLTPDRLVLFDWEPCIAPPAIDFAWYLSFSASRIDASREQVIDDYRRIAGDRFDPTAFDLACIGALLQHGWEKAIDIVEHPDPEIREQARADLDWWVQRSREALETWSPV